MASVPDKIKLTDTKQLKQLGWVIGDTTNVKNMMTQLLRFSRSHYPGVASKLVVKNDGNVFYTTIPGEDKTFAIYDPKEQTLQALGEAVAQSQYRFYRKGDSDKKSLLQAPQTIWATSEAEAMEKFAARMDRTYRKVRGMSDDQIASVLARVVPEKVEVPAPSGSKDWGPDRDVSGKSYWESVESIEETPLTAWQSRMRKRGATSFKPATKSKYDGEVSDVEIAYAGTEKVGMFSKSQNKEINLKEDTMSTHKWFLVNQSNRVIGNTQGYETEEEAEYAATNYRGFAPSSADVRIVNGSELQESADEEFDDEESGYQEFYIALYSERTNKSFIGRVSKDGGKWREDSIAGEAPYNWSGSTYMSYLTPSQVMQWLHKDYERGYEIAGPFDSEDEARDHVEYEFGSESLDEDDGMEEGVADIAQLKRKPLNQRTPRDQAAINAYSKKPQSDKVVVSLRNADGTKYKETLKPISSKQTGWDVAQAYLKQITQTMKMTVPDEMPPSIDKVEFKRDGKVVTTWDGSGAIMEGSLEEISAQTLASYAKKATDDISYNSFTAGELDAKDPERLEHDKVAMKRQRGVERAIDRLSGIKTKSMVDESVFDSGPGDKEHYLDWCAKHNREPDSWKTVRDYADLFGINTTTENKLIKQLNLKKSPRLNEDPVAEAFDQDAYDGIVNAIQFRLSRSPWSDQVQGYSDEQIENAIEDVARFHAEGGLDELGSSDISIMTKEVIRWLSEYAEPMSESVFDSGPGDKEHYLDWCAKHNREPDSWKTVRDYADLFGINTTTENKLIKQLNLKKSPRLNEDPVAEARFEKGGDIGKPGKMFSKIAKSAAKKYGSEEAGQRVAGAVLKKVLAKEDSDGMEPCEADIMSSSQANESAMSDLDLEIQDMIEPVVAEYRKYGGADALGAAAVDIAKQIASKYNIPTKVASGWVNDHIEAALDESTESAEVTEGRFPALVAIAQKDGSKFYIWQKHEGGYEYEIEPVPLGSKKSTSFEGELSDLEAQGYTFDH